MLVSATGSIAVSLYMTITSPQLSTYALSGSLSVGLQAPESLQCSPSGSGSIPATAMGVTVAQSGLLGSNGVTLRDQNVVVTSAVKAARVLTNDFDGTTSVSPPSRDAASGAGANASVCSLPSSVCTVCVCMDVPECGAHLACVYMWCVRPCPPFRRR